MASVGQLFRRATGTASKEHDHWFASRNVGTAVRAAADYAMLLDYFDQITPENAGKWAWRPRETS